jgi:hypothetical protein
MKIKIIKPILIISTLLFIGGCSKKSKTSDIAEDLDSIKVHLLSCMNETEKQNLVDLLYEEGIKQKNLDDQIPKSISREDFRLMLYNIDMRFDYLSENEKRIINSIGKRLSF